MRGLVRRVSTGQRGFTLIELLVVVAILGIIAAVVVLNIGGFLGEGAQQAANTEAHQVQTAVVAWMAKNPATSPAGTLGPTSANDHDAKDFLLNPSTLQAVYTIATDGSLSGAVPITGSQWGTLTFSDGSWS